MPVSLEVNNNIRSPFWKLVLINLGKYVAVVPLLIAVILGLILVSLVQLRNWCCTRAQETSLT